MGKRQITSTEITCDYPEHGPLKLLVYGNEYHLLQGVDEVVICTPCWNNLMTVEKLLKVLDIIHRVENSIK